MGFSRLILEGDVLEADITSPLGTLTHSPYMLLADLQPHGGVLPMELPGEPGVVGISPGFVRVIDGFTGVLPMGFPGVLPQWGVEFTATAPAVPSLSRLVVQAAVADPVAPNGLAVTEVVGGAFGAGPNLTAIYGGSVQLAQFGYALASVDLDGDDADELIVGAREEDAPSAAIAGRVSIYSGNPPVLQQYLDDPAPQVRAHFGVSVATGDLNGDGFLDIVVGARQSDTGGETDAGKVVIYYGPAYTQAFTIESPVPEFRGQFGHRAVCGDFDGDGWCDLVVSSIGSGSAGVPQAGVVDVFLGPSLAPWVRVENPIPGPGDRFGYRLDAGDVNGDGFDDLVVAAPFKALQPGLTDDSGAIYVLMGPTMVLGTYFPNPVPSVSGLLGADVACADLDGDGYQDIIAGAEFDDSGGLTAQGSVYVLRGPGFFNVSQFYSPAPVANGGFGSGVSVGDWDGDGDQDLMVGEFFYSGASPRSGRAHIMLGPDYLQAVTVEEPFTGSDYQFGRRVRAADMDGDGRMEMAVGVPLSSASFIPRSGAVYLVSF